MSLRQKVVRSLSWNLLGRVGTQIFQQAFNIALARMLTPKEFGVIGMLLVFTGFAQILSDGGLNSALIYFQDAMDDHYSTAFWLQLCIGLILGGAFFAFAPGLAWFYGIPILKPLTRVAASVFVLQAIGQTQYAALCKTYQFRKIATVTTVATAVSGLLAVFLAWHGLGVWALAWQMISLPACMSAGFWLVSNWRPRFRFSIKLAKELGAYGYYLVGHGWLNYWTRNGDNLTIGKVFGALPLGIYSRAYSLMLLPLNNIASVVGQVMFPALSEMQSDIVRFGRTYVKATQVIALVSFPLMAGLGVLSGPVVALLYGEKWNEVAPLLRIMSLIGLGQSIIFPVAWVYSGLGKTRTQFQLSVFLLFAFAIAMFVGIRYGLLGVVYAYFVWAALSGYLNLLIVGKFLEVSMWKILSSVGRIAAMTTIMGFLVFEVDAMFLDAHSSALRVAAGTAVGAASYLAMCLVARDRTFAEFLDLSGVTRLWQKRRLLSS